MPDPRPASLDHPDGDVEYMQFGTDFLERYLQVTPIPLALERAMECDLHSRHQFPRPMLDIGCGEGLFTRILFDSQVDTGIDPDQRELDRARELGGYSDLIQCSGDAIPKPAAAYRSILINSTLEHIPGGPLPVLTEAHRLLAPGGLCYVTVPNERFIEYSWIRILLRSLRLERLADTFTGFFRRFWNLYNVYPVATWNQLFSQAGFEIVEQNLYECKDIYLFKEAAMFPALPSRVFKLVTNRWIMAPPVLRRLLMRPVLHRLSRHMPTRFCNDGALIYAKLRKL